MKPLPLFCAMTTVFLLSPLSARGEGLAVDIGAGYRSWKRGDVTVSRSYVEVAPSYTTGRWRLAAPVKVAFRATDAPFSAANPLAFKSDDWVNLDVELEYRGRRTRVTLQHDSLQLLSSGVLPERGFGDVETENRLLVHHAVSRLAGARLNALGGYWGMDRWTQTQHGRCRGPVFGVGLEPSADGWAPVGLLLVGHAGDGTFHTAVLGFRYRRASWRVEGLLECRRFPGGERVLFGRGERRWNLALVKGLR